MTDPDESWYAEANYCWQHNFYFEPGTGCPHCTEMRDAEALYRGAKLAGPVEVVE